MPDLSKVDPAAARRLLSFELSLWCQRAGVRHVEVGERLGVSRASASQMLAGKNLPSRPALEVVLNFVGAEERLPLLLDVLSIARRRSESRESPVRDGHLAVGLAAASEVIDVCDFGRLTPLIHDGTVDTARIYWLIAEHALRDLANGDAREQLEKLTTRSTVSVRVVPDGAGPVSGFRVFHSTAWTVAYQETLTTAHYFTDPGPLAEYTRAVDSLKRAALDEDRSRSLLAKLLQNPRSAAP